MPIPPALGLVWRIRVNPFSLFCVLLWAGRIPLPHLEEVDTATRTRSLMLELGSAVDIVLSSVEERYELGDMIGVGHFSQVHCARPAGSLGEHSIALKGIE